MMTNYFNKYASFLFVTIIVTHLASCNKNWLEAKPDKSLTVPSTLDDYQKIFNNIGYVTAASSLKTTASDEYYITDVSFNNVPPRIDKDVYIWSKNFRHEEVLDWNGLYAVILHCNIVLEGLAEISPTNDLEQQKWNNVRGKALFLRAWLFFELAQTFSPPYSYGGDNQSPGLVLKLASDITALSKRSTVKDTYEQILKDLNEAKQLLPVRPLYLAHASASGAYALLARVYLSMEDYNNALLAADECLKLYNQLLDYNSIPENAGFIGLYNAEVLFHANYNPNQLVFVSNILVDTTLVSLYEQNDLRKTRFYSKNVNNTYSFKGNYDATTFSYFCGLATDEIYLIRAECYARAGKTTEALKDLNDLLIKRWDKNFIYPAITTNNPTEVLAIILTERRKELVFRGVRWSDLRRLNKDPRFAITLKRKVGENEYVLEPDSYKYTLPLPDDIIEQSGMKQNAGWE